MIYLDSTGHGMWEEKTSYVWTLAPVFPTQSLFFLLRVIFVIYLKPKPEQGIHWSSSTFFLQCSFHSLLLSLTVSRVPKLDYISSGAGVLSLFCFWRAKWLSTEVGEGRRQKATTECPGILWLWLVCLLKMLFLIFWCVPWKHVCLHWWVSTVQV